MNILQFFALLTLLSHLSFIFFVLLLLLKNVFPKQVQKLFLLIQNKQYLVYLCVVTTATLGSLSFSEMLHFPPCKLCWYQRMFMYPQLIILLSDLIKKTKSGIRYLFVFNGIGLCFSLYHYYIQLFPSVSSLVCSADDPVSCTAKASFFFGYISIPLMAATAFTINLIVLAISHRKKRHV